MRRKGNHVKWLLWAFMSLLSVRAAVAHEIIYVDADAAGAGDGSNWTNAYWCLQDALAGAWAGAEIRVANGVYKPDRRQNGWSHGQARTRASGSRDETFQLINGAVLKGGYAGYGQPDPNVRDTARYETILSGDLNGDDGPGFGGNEDNSRYGVVSSLTNDAATVLSGFTIVGGHADGGAGIRCMVSDLQVRDCKIAQNESEGQSGGDGGAIISYFGSPAFRNCVLEGNKASGDGGGVWIEGGRPVFEGCLFKENMATSDGGGLHAFDANHVTLVDCIFVDNSSRQRGGGIWHAGGKLELTGCEFTGNLAFSPFDDRYGYGGAVYTIAEAKSEVIDCTFYANRARDGGAIYGTAQSIENCRFTANTAERGGALGEIQDSTIRNSVFAGNRADVGGAICTSGSGPSLIFCTLSGNSALDGSSIGRSPRFHAPGFLSMNISNCILWNDGDEIGTLLDELPDISIVYSDIRGGWPGQGNIDIDPHFADSGHWQPDLTMADVNDNVWVDGDYHLKSQTGRWGTVSESWVSDNVTSPCIDAGYPNRPVAFEPFPNGGIVNMGAYGGTARASKSHFDGPVLTNRVAGDINADDKVNLVDLLAVIAHWTDGAPPILEERPLLVVDRPRDGARLEMSGETILIHGGVYDPDNSIANVSIQVHGGGASWNTRRGAIQKKPSAWPVEYMEWEWDDHGQSQMGPGQYTIIVEALDKEGHTLVSPEVSITLLE